ncbi:MAG: hypothetical protein J7K54_03810 [Candidatus Aenigmarchaeota archaeon]|nr:hypothetical protein [Candidatus Aenigmarchaeota archaeon]
MRASKWIIEKLLKMVSDEDPCRHREEAEKIFSRYHDDTSLNKIKEDIMLYCKKPSKSRLEKIKTQLDDILVTRKFEASGGTSLWFNDRRITRSSRASR